MPYNTTLQHYSMPYNTTLQHYSMPYSTLRYNTTPCHTTLRYNTTPCHTTLRYNTTPCHTTLRYNTTPCHTTLRYNTTPCHTTLRYNTTPCHTTLRYNTTPCHATTLLHAIQQNSLASIVLGSADTRSSTSRISPTSTGYPSGQESTPRSLSSRSKHLSLSDLPVCLNYFSSARCHDSSISATIICHAAPSVWNSLLPQLTADFNSTFKRNLKTHFYRLSFKS